MEENVFLENDPLEQRRIYTFTELPQRRFLFRMHGIPCFPKGELVAVSGKAKSGKTFFTSILMSLCVRPILLDMQRIEAEQHHVLWFDTEQSEESTQEILSKRISKLCGEDGDLFALNNFHVYNVRSVNWQERLDFFRQAVKRSEADLVIVDGIRDFVNDINDGIKSQLVVEELMHLASAYNCCIVCVIHQNKASEDKNLRGWLGTELTYKAFEMYECEKSQNRIFSCTQTMTRKYDIYKPLYFSVNNNGLPETADFSAKYLATDKSRSELNPEYVENGEVNIEKAFEALLPGTTEMRAMELEIKFKSLLNMSSGGWYNKLRQEAIDKGIIEKHEIAPNNWVIRRVRSVPEIQKFDI